MGIGQGEILQKTHVRVGVSRTAERVSSDSRSPGVTDVKESFAAAGKVTVVLEERGSGTIVAGAAKICYWTHRRKSRASGKQQRLSVGHRSPWEAAMGSKDAVQFPPAKHVAQKVMTAAQDRNVPKTGQD